MSSPSKEEIKLRFERFNSDARYRIETLFKVKLFQKRDIVPLRFNEAQVRLYEAHQWFRERRMPVRIIICKSRRAGLSTGVQALVFDDTIRNPNTMSLIVANQLSPSENVLSMSYRFLNYMPKAMRLETDAGVEEYLVRPELNKRHASKPPSDRIELEEPIASKVFIASANSVDQYLSYDFQNIHATEASRYQNAPELFRSLSPTLSDDEHSAQYIESTPNGQSGRGAWFYEQVMEASLRESTEFGETKLVFIPWHEMGHSFSRPFSDMSERARFERTLNQDERDIIKRFEVSLEQLAWRRMKLASSAFNMDEELFDQEYPSDLASAFISSGTNVFSKKSIKRMISNVREPLWEGDIYWGDSEARNERESAYNTVRRPHFYTAAEAQAEGFKSHVTDKTYRNLKVWRWPKKGERLILGADIGRGNPLTKDGDPSTICVLSMTGVYERDQVLMTWRGKMNPIAFGEVCAALAWGLRAIVGNEVRAPLLAPEWTGPGAATCTYLDQKKLYEVDRYRQPGVSGMPKGKHIGWESNSKTKPVAVNWMVRTVEADQIDIWSKELVLEMSSYRQHDKYGDEGSYGGVGGHDDLVSAFQIANAVLRLETQTNPTDHQVLETDLNMPGTGLEPFDELSAPRENVESYLYGFDDSESDSGDGLFW